MVLEMTDRVADMGQANRKPVIIEFYGLPGAGKTTTAFAIQKQLRNMEIRVLSPKRIIDHQCKYKEIVLSKEIRDVYIIFLKALFLVRPITRERIRFMNMAFNYWLGIKNFHIAEKQKNGICILDQGIVQAFVSMAYLGKITNKEKYCRCIQQVVDMLDNVIFVNCRINPDISIMRMRARKPNGGRLQQIKNDNELRKMLQIQMLQFERITEKSVKGAIMIHMNEQAEANAEKIVEYCLGCSYKSE